MDLDLAPLELSNLIEYSRPIDKILTLKIKNQETIRLTQEHLKSQKIIIEFDIKSIKVSKNNELLINSNIDRYYKVSILFNSNNKTQTVQDFSDYSHRIHHPHNMFVLSIPLSHIEKH